MPAVAEPPLSFSAAGQRYRLETQPLLSFLGKAHLWVYGLLWVTMLSLSFAIPAVQTGAMRIRWPVLGLAAAVGLWQLARIGFKNVPAAVKAMAAFLLMLLVSTAYSLDWNYTAQRTASVAMLFAATLVGLYLLGRRWANAVAATDVLFVIGALLVVIGFAFRAAVGGGAGERFEGLHNRATGAGSYAALFLPVAMFQASYRLKGVFKLFGWLIVLLLLAQAFLAGARMAALTGLGIALTLGAFYNARRALVCLVASVLLLPLPFLLNPKNADKLKEKSGKLVRAESFGTFTGRLDRWVFGLEQFARRPVLGFGFGSSRTLAGNEDPARFKLEPGEVFNLHSDQIEVLMDVGVVGFAPFALFWGLLLWAGVRTARRPATPARQMALAYFGGVLYAFADTFMHGGFLAAGGGVSAFSWSMAAMFLVLAVEHTEAAERRPTAVKRQATRTPVGASAAVEPERRPLRDVLPRVGRLGGVVAGLH